SCGRPHRAAPYRNTGRKCCSGVEPSTVGQAERWNYVGSLRRIDWKNGTSALTVSCCPVIVSWHTKFFRMLACLIKNPVCHGPARPAVQSD
ncbi:hypothetical protein, partial [uncultured Gimesia sp.]|uniref:hypothetical protein n=1 Tax=uncultured Gimesia sp. TaxID=1678688 RepID=UPI0030DA2E71